MLLRIENIPENLLKMKDLHNKKLSSDKVATVASIIAKDKKIRKLVHSYQLNLETFF